MAQRKIIWSYRAKLDLLSILDFFYRRNQTKSYSDKLNSTIKKSVRILSKHPEIGIKTDIQDVRGLILGDYIIFYKIKSETIEILTIWDSRQDPEKIRV